MKYLKLFEAFIQKAKNLLIVEKGTELFRGGSRDYEKILKVNSEGVVWTTETSAIAQTYIASNIGNLHCSTSFFVSPLLNERDRDMQRQLGIVYDYDDMEWNGVQAKNYKIVPAFAHMYEAYWKAREIYYNAVNRYEEIGRLLKTNLADEEEDKLVNEMDEIEKKLPEYKKDFFDLDLDTLRNEYVNKKLEELGYKPKNTNEFRKNYQWRISYTEENDVYKIAPSGIRRIGRLFIFTTKRDLKIFDTTDGGEREADLNDEDYWKLDWFRTADEAGYDGIKIADHAQSEDLGNFGHTSIGLFDRALKDIELTSIPAMHHDLQSHYDDSDWESPEYKKYKENK